MLRSWLRLSAVACFAAVAALGTPPLTQIQDVIYKANGTLFDGVAQIEWNSFVASDNSAVAQNTTSIRIVRGQLRVSLIPTTDAQQSVTYTVRFNSEGKTQFVEAWAVPPSRSALKLSDVRTSYGGGATAGNLTSGMSISDVTGLRTELDMRPTRGATWAPRRAAVIGSNGTLESALGSDTDCVRVDGSSAPCGAIVNYVDADTPSGVVDGVNRTFTLGAAPLPTESLRLFINGLLQVRGVDYTLTGTSVFLLTARPPAPGSIFLAWYRTSGSVASLVDAEIPGGVLNGLNPTFTLKNAPLPAASLQIYRNGVLQKAFFDYWVAGNTVTFLPLSVPLSGDTLVANYRR